MKLKLSEITIDAGTQSRRSIDQASVLDYAQLMTDGVVFPPIVVFGEKYILADGWHRYWACKKAAIKEIEVESKEGTIRDAIFYGISANNQHGIPMTREDKHDNCKKMLMDVEWGNFGDRVIASKVGLSKNTVGKIRKALEAEGRIATSDNRTYIRDGQEITAKIPEHDDLTPEEKARNVERFNELLNKVATAEALEQEAQQPTEGETKSRAEDLQQIKELNDAVDILEAENIKMRDAIAIGAWDATDIEKEDIEETVKDLRNQIKILEMENETLRSSRDMYMNQASELERINKSLRNKLKKFEQ
jgi:ParB-like chromosome segregation protein Spo0J